MNKRTGAFIGLVLLVGVVLIVVGKLVERTDEKATSYPAPVTKVDLDVTDAKVRLVASPLQSVDLKQTNNFVMRSPEVKITFENGTLNIKQECKSFNIGRCDSKFELAIPANAAVNVKGGEVDASSLRSELTVNSDSFKGTELFGKVDVTTKSGSIDMKKLSSLDYKAQTTSGKISIEAAAQPNNVDLKTTSGGVSIRLPERPGPYKIDAASGSGRLTLDLKNTPDAQRVVRIQSDSGNINIAKSS